MMLDAARHSATQQIPVNKPLLQFYLWRIDTNLV